MMTERLSNTSRKVRIVREATGPARRLVPGAGSGLPVPRRSVTVALRS
jgi:hypothetical protein